HFTGFIVRWVAVGDTLDCAQAKSACGGSLGGTYKLAAICPVPVFTDPLWSCTDSQIISTLHPDGKIVMTSSTFDADLEEHATYVLRASASCLSANHVTSCEQVQTALMPGWPIPSLTCSSNGSGGCDCTGYQYP